MLILSIFLYQKLSKYFLRKTCSKYSRGVRTTAPPDVAWLNTEIPCITNLYIFQYLWVQHGSIINRDSLPALYVPPPLLPATLGGGGGPAWTVQIVNGGGGV
jgi:hypothetical protein